MIVTLAAVAFCVVCVAVLAYLFSSGSADPFGFDYYDDDF